MQDFILGTIGFLGIVAWFLLEKGISEAPLSVKKEHRSNSATILDGTIGSKSEELQSLATTEPAKVKSGNSSPIILEKGLITEKEILEARSEIKISLAALYGAEKSFFSEYGRYSTDLLYGVGYIPSDEKRWTKLGFLSPYNPPSLEGREDPRFLNTDFYLSERDSPTAQFKYRKNAEQISLDSFRHFCKFNCTASAQHFELIAATQLAEGFAAEVWIINDKKEMIQVQDGTKPQIQSKK